MDLKGRVVVVTGASSGIGAATARAMAARGAHAVLLARRPDALDAVARDIAARGGRATVVPADLARPEQARLAADRVVREAGVPHVLVNNAGAGRWLFIDEMAADDIDRMLGVPFLGAFHLTWALLPGMIARGTGTIVTVNSPAALVPWPGAFGYTCSRWALRGFTEALRADLRGTGLRVAAVMFGRVSSGYWDHNPGSEERIPRLGRLMPTLTPEQAAAAVVRAVERDRREVLAPFMLRVLVLQQRVLPALTADLVARTGVKRPAAPHPSPAARDRLS